MTETFDSRQYRPHVARNRDPILDVLRRVLPAKGLVLEIASGSGEHAAYFAAKLPDLAWQPTDPDPEALASAAAHRAGAHLPNLLTPLQLDVTSPQWSVDRADAVICCNMIHIAPWTACEGLVAGAARVLPPAARFISTDPTRSAIVTPRRPIRRSTNICGHETLPGAFVTLTTSRRLLPGMVLHLPKPCRCRPTISA